MKTKKPKKLTSTIEWVSVEERLPGDYLFHLVITKSGREAEMAQYLPHQKKWEDCFSRTFEVTHWAEMPVFPEEK